MYSIKNNLKLAIFLIIILASILRLYKLGFYPVSLYWDEAAIGYNAYAIAQTGADEYGKKWPLAFESFNDYKLPGYVYLDSIFIKFLDLSEFSVRLPSAISGILAVFIIYLLTKKLFENEIISQLAAFTLAISPWHIHLSRAAFETNIALTIVLTGIYLLMLGAKSQLSALISIPITVLSFYFYYSSYTFIPLMLIAFFIIYRKSISQNIKYYLAGLIIGTVIVMPATSNLLTTEGSKRVKEVSIFADPSLVEPYVQAATSDNNIISKLFLNRRIPLTVESLDNYFSHFSPGFLFFGTEINARHHPLFQGNFYIYQMPFLIAGVWFLVKLKDSRLKYFLLSWIFISLVPAAFTTETPHSLRSYNLIIPLAITIAFGVIYLLKNNLTKILTLIVAAFFFIGYLYNYYVVYPVSSSEAWAYGYKSMFEKVIKIENNYDRIVVTGHYWKPYIYYLFYNQIDPKVYQASPNQIAIGKYRFGIAGWDTGGQNLNEKLINSLKGNKTLLVTSPDEFTALEDKSHFDQISQIQDYSGNKEIFLIGEWQ